MIITALSWLCIISVWVYWGWWLNDWWRARQQRKATPFRVLIECEHCNMHGWIRCSDMASVDMAAREFEGKHQHV